ncbi:MAG: LLM class F420-dependent oxidoreductase [Alphaproteobacteria bacterium]|jgi:probable F420-dependent oxidoreductase|nr:LLM class F420-dependent oxidoreductase [Alphaproteobacteria bacterium]MDP6815421.1 LLM class F420-dependent oxidoreductase [Alphaproteobacteria bacterium]
MDIGLVAPLPSAQQTPAYIAALGRGAEERGFSTIWLSEHAVLFDDYLSQYPYSPDGRIPFSGPPGLLDPMPTLGFLAAHTERIRLGTGICLVPQRNPVYTAKEVAAIDHLSNGRFNFGVGVGWLAEEFAALDVPFEGRGARCREYIEVMKRLWCDEISEFSGAFYDLPACRQYPKPTQQPHPPIYFGGESEAALRRTADLGQGWYSFRLTAERAAECIARLRGHMEAAGREMSELEIAVGAWTSRVDQAALEAYHAAGVDQLVLVAMTEDADSLLRLLDKLAENILAPAAQL